MTIGFDQSDPLRTRNYGYRSDDFRKHNQNFVDASIEALVEYNGFQFPPICKVQASFVPEYDKTGRTIKYHTLIVTVDCVITDYTRPSPTASSPTIDNEMDAIRKRLMEPRQGLKVRYQGLGNIEVNTGVSTSDGLMVDINNGPKPQVLEWQPLGGGSAAHIQWLVSAQIGPCFRIFPFVSATYSQKYSFSPQGFLTRSLMGEAEFAVGRQYTGSDKAVGNIDLTKVKQRWQEAINYFNTIFKDGEGFHRTVDTEIDEAKRIIKYSIKEEEIPSPTPYPKGAFDANFNESLSSNLSAGFRTWNWTLSGTISVNNHVQGRHMIPLTKASCFSALGLIVRDRITRVDSVNFQRGLDKDEASLAEEKNKAVTRILQSIRISNEIFGTEIGLDVTYKLICTSNLLFVASGMFDHVAIPGVSWKDWQNWRRAYDPGLSDPYAPINYLPDTEIIVNPCNQLVNVAAGTGPTSQATIPYSEGALIPDTIPKEEDTWIRYHNRLEFISPTGTIAGTFLSSSAREESETKTKKPYDEKKLQLSPAELVSKGSDRQPYAVDYQTNEEPIVYVRLIGSAMRLGYPINAPQLESIGGVTAVKYGTDVLSPESQPLGFSGRTVDGKQLKSVNMHRLSWEKTYMINGLPSNWLTKMTGHPQFYV